MDRFAVLVEFLNPGTQIVEGVATLFHDVIGFYDARDAHFLLLESEVHLLADQTPLVQQLQLVLSCAGLADCQGFPFDGGK